MRGEREEGRLSRTRKVDAPFIADVRKSGMGGICISSGFCFSALMAKGLEVVGVTVGVSEAFSRRECRSTVRPPPNAPSPAASRASEKHLPSLHHNPEHPWRSRMSIHRDLEHNQNWLWTQHPHLYLGTWTSFQLSLRTHSRGSWGFPLWLSMHRGPRRAGVPISV